MSDFFINAKCLYCNNIMQTFSGQIRNDEFTMKCYHCRPEHSPTTYVYRASTASILAGLVDAENIIEIWFWYFGPEKEDESKRRKIYLIKLLPKAQQTLISNFKCSSEKDYTDVIICDFMLPLTPYNIDKKLPTYLTFI